MYCRGVFGARFHQRSKVGALLQASLALFEPRQKVLGRALGRGQFVRILIRGQNLAEGLLRRAEHTGARALDVSRTLANPHTGTCARTLAHPPTLHVETRTRKITLAHRCPDIIASPARRVSAWGVPPKTKIGNKKHNSCF